jgi:hypothetical protein
VNSADAREGFQAVKLRSFSCGFKGTARMKICVVQIKPVKDDIEGSIDKHKETIDLAASGAGGRRRLRRENVRLE